MQPTTIVHQVYIADDMALPTRLPAALEENVQSVRSVHPDAEYRMWSGNDIRQFIADVHGQRTLWAFDLLTPYSYKCDLARYCLLDHFGGLYVDLGMRMMSAITPPDHIGIVTFRAPDFATPSWLTMSAGLIWSQPGRGELTRAIAMILDNCEARRYGADPLYPTGPVVLGRAMAAEVATKGQERDADDQWVGASRALTPESSNSNIGYVSPDGCLVAWRTKRVGGDLSDLGFEGGNNYITLWRQRNCFSEMARLWRFDDPYLCLTPQATRNSRGVVARSHARGVLTYGPYIEWEAGRFRFTVAFDEPTQIEGFALDVMREPADIVARLECGPSREAVDSLSMEFEFSTPVKQAQFRTSALADFDGCITEIRVERV
jgi:hypothetical protein